MNVRFAPRLIVALALMMAVFASVSMVAIAQTSDDDTTPAVVVTAAASPEFDTVVSNPVPTTVPASDSITIDPDGTVTIATTPTNEAASAGLQLGVGILVGFLTGGLTVGGIAAFIMRDPARIKLMEKLADSVPPATAATITKLADGVLQFGELVKEAFDRIPYETKAPTTTAGPRSEVADNTGVDADALPSAITRKSTFKTPPQGWSDSVILTPYNPPE